MNEQNNNPLKTINEAEKTRKGLIWVIAVILLFLLATTVCLVYSVIARYSVRPQEPERIEIEIDISSPLSPGQTTTAQTTTATTPGQTTVTTRPPETTTTVTTTEPVETTTTGGGHTPPEPETTTGITVRPSTQTPPPKVDVGEEGNLWNTDTHIELFKAVYSSDDGEARIVSSNGDLVLAPGAGNIYELKIKNVGNVGVVYTIDVWADMSTEISGTVLTIPLKARFNRVGGDYYVGSASELEDISALDGLSVDGSLGRSRYVLYNLEWQWPMDGNDEFDTLLGNLAAQGQEITAAIKMKVTAVSDKSASGGTPLSQ